MKEMGKIKLTKQHINPNGAMWGYLLNRICDEAAYMQCKADEGKECRTVVFPRHELPEPFYEGDWLKTVASQVRAGKRSFDYEVMVYLLRGEEDTRLVTTLKYTMVTLKEDDGKE